MEKVKTSNKDIEKGHKCRMKSCNDKPYRNGYCMDCWVERGGYQDYRF